MGDNDADSSGSIEGNNMYKNSKEKLMLILLSNLYLELEIIFVSIRWPSFYSTSHCLLTTFKLPTTILRKNVNNFGLKRLFYLECLLFSYIDRSQVEL